MVIFQALGFEGAMTIGSHGLGAVRIAGGVTYDPTTRTLTCISTGGPATTVTWTRDSTTVTEGNETVLNDPVTANYTHSLTVTTGGLYTCNVTNNKPSSASANITVTGIIIQPTALCQASISNYPLLSFSWQFTHLLLM